MLGLSRRELNAVAINIWVAGQLFWLKRRKSFLRCSPFTSLQQRWPESGLVIQPLFIDIDATFLQAKRCFFSEDRDIRSFRFSPQKEVMP
jgi:hypothetical protein